MEIKSNVKWYIKRSLEDIDTYLLYVKTNTQTLFVAGIFYDLAEDLFGKETWEAMYECISNKELYEFEIELSWEVGEGFWDE